MGAGWEKQHEGVAASWSDIILVCVLLAELLQELECFAFIVVWIDY